MTVLDQQLDQVRSWSDDDAWRRRLIADAQAIRRFLPARLRPVHGAVVRRARLVEAKALILSGSTARGRRTAISDLDYHLVGPKIKADDLPHELDLHVLSKDRLEAEILAGDDFVQWSLRFGCVLSDDGTLREALRLIANRRPWPDVERKRRHAAKSLELAGRVVETGDDDGALVQVRTALSLTARAFLLSRGTFPMTRADLPGQLADAGCLSASAALEASIEGHPSLDQLAVAVDEGRGLLGQINEPSDRRRPSIRR
ncbi:MAG: hypothetical protein V7607_3865 [Solirubrobacteraceae bacterium]